MTQGNQTVAQQLFKAFQDHEPIPFISKSVELSEPEAYATQDLLIEQLKDAQNVEVAGYKVSMTSAATQSIANTHEPAYGTILSNKVFKHESEIAVSELFDPLIEPEIMFILTADLPQDPSAEEVLDSVRIAPGIEVPDARYQDWFPNFTLGDLLADNTATGLIVVGEEVAPLSYDKFADIQLSLSFNGEEIETGDSTEVLGNPVKSVQWLAKKLADHGKQLKAGQVISSGTFISPIPVKKGTYDASYSDVGSGKVTFK